MSTSSAWNNGKSRSIDKRGLSYARQRANSPGAPSSQRPVNSSLSPADQRALAAADDALRKIDQVIARRTARGER